MFYLDAKDMFAGGGKIWKEAGVDAIPSQGVRPSAWIQQREVVCGVVEAGLHHHQSEGRDGAVVFIVFIYSFLLYSLYCLSVCTFFLQYYVYIIALLTYLPDLSLQDGCISS